MYQTRELPKKRLLLASEDLTASSLSFQASTGILIRTRAGSPEPEAAKQPETAEELEELRRPTGWRQPSIAQRAPGHRKPLGSKVLT